MRRNTAFTTDAMPRKLHDDIVKRLGMTGSTHDGEALNAIRAANRLLREHKLTWRDALEPEPEPPALSAPALTPAEALLENWPTHWRQAARYASTFAGCIPHKEVQFALQLVGWKTTPSEKQLLWLEHIMERVASVENAL
jgi:hypothetical protein